MDPKNSGGRKRLPRIAASLIRHVTSEMEPSFIVHRASLRPPPIPSATPGHEYGDFPYSSARSKSKSSDSLASAPSEESSPSGLQSAGGHMLSSLAFTEDDNDSDEDCLSLKNLNSPSERDSFLIGQGDTAESSPKRGKRTGGKNGHFVVNFYKLNAILACMYFSEVCGHLAIAPMCGRRPSCWHNVGYAKLYRMYRIFCIILIYFTSLILFQHDSVFVRTETSMETTECKNSSGLC